MMLGLSDAPVAACSSIFLPEGFTGNVTCDNTAGGVNYVSNPISAGETDTEPLLPCSSYTVPPGFEGSIPCDSNGGSQINIAAPEVMATATVTQAAANTGTSTTATSGASNALVWIAILGLGVWALSHEGGGV